MTTADIPGRASRGGERGEAGQAIIELLFAIPVLLVILFGIVEFANAWRTSELITNVAREGARRTVAAGAPNNATALDTEVKDIVQKVGLVRNRATVTFSCQTGGQICSTTGDEQKVTVDYAYHWIALGPIIRLLPTGGGYTGSITITGVSSMRTE